MRKFFILLTLTMFTFVVGHAQFDVKTQPGYDAQLEEIYGQPPVSDELPDYLDLSGMMKGNRDLTGIKGYGMLIPKSGSYNGVLYGIDFETGKVSTIKRYTNYYFTAMENVNDTAVYVYCNDLTRGFGTINPQSGLYTKRSKVSKGMEDMTFCHPNNKLYGMRYGQIYEVNPTNGSVSALTKDGNYIAIACSTGGDMYAITATTPASLVKFTYNDDEFDFENPTVVKQDLGHDAQRTQTMTYEHNTDKLIWWQVSDSEKNIIELDTSGNVIFTKPVTSSVGGLWVPFQNGPHKVTPTQPTGATVTLSKENPDNQQSGGDKGDAFQAKKGDPVYILVDTLEYCNTITAVTVKNSDNVNVPYTKIRGGLYTFVMPSKDVTVDVGIQVNPRIKDVTITANPALDPETSTSKVCEGGSVTLTPNVEADLPQEGEAGTLTIKEYKWYSTNGENDVYVTTTTPAKPDYIASEAGIYYVTAVSTYGCAESSNNVVVDIQVKAPTKPTIGIDGTSVTTKYVCYGKDLTLGLTNAEYSATTAFYFTWKAGDDTLEYGEDKRTYTLKNITANKSITVTVSDPDYPGCDVTSDVLTINVNPLPVITVTGETTICYNTKPTLTASAGDGNYNYEWFNGETSVCTGASLNLSNPLTQNTTLTVKATNTATGCDDSKEVTVTVKNDLADLTITAEPEGEVCYGTSVTFTTANVEGYSYVWKDGLTEITGANSYTYTMENASVGTHGITVEATYNGCTKVSPTKTLTVNELPNVQISLTEGSNPICADKTVTLTASGAEDYEWSCDGITFSNPKTNPLTFTTPKGIGVKEYTINVTGTDDKGCENSSSFELTVNPLPSVALTNTVDLIQVCEDGKAILNIKEPVAGYTYKWYYGDYEEDPELLEYLTSGTQYVVDFTGIEPGSGEDTKTGFYSVQAIDGNGCGDDVFTKIAVALVLPPNQPTIVGPEKAICYNTTTELRIYEGGIEPSDYVYYWEQKVGGEFVCKDTTYAPSYQYTTDNLKENTDFRVGISYYDSQETSNCVSYSDVLTVKVKENKDIPVRAYYNDDTGTLTFSKEKYHVCVDNPYDLKVSEEYNTYQWYIDSIGNGTWLALDRETSNVYTEYNNIIYHSGIYKYKVVVTDDDNCGYDGFTTVNVYEEPTITITGAKEICVGVGSEYSATVEESTPGEYTYNWEWASEPTKPVQFIGETNQQTVNIKGAEAAEVTLKVTVKNNLTTCEKTQTFKVTINPLPELSITSPANGTYDMIDGSISLTAEINKEVSTAGTFYLDGEVFTGTSIDPTTLSTGEHEVKLEYTDDNGCYNETSVKFTIEKHYWSDDGIREAGWYKPAETDLELQTAEDYGYFVFLLNSGQDNFEGKTIRVTNHIDLGERYVEPHTGFKGTFDGYGKIISNMTMCDTIKTDIENNGIIRNLGLKDAKINLRSGSNEVNLNNNGRILNSFITGTVFTLEGNSEFNINNNLIENIYLTNDLVSDKVTLNIVEKGTINSAFSKPAVSFDGVEIPEYESIETLLTELNKYVDNFNSTEFWGWVKDGAETEGELYNNGFPVFSSTPYMVHYIVDLRHVENGTGSLKRSQLVEEEEGVFIDIPAMLGKTHGYGSDPLGINDTTIFAFGYDTVTVTIAPDEHMMFDSLSVWTASGVQVQPYVATPEGETDAYYYFCMPADDSIRIKANISKDYWTNGNYAEFTWYKNSQDPTTFRITSAEDLAGLARIVNGINLPEGISKDDFENKVVRIDADNIDLSAHVWKPIEGFKGTLEGYGKYIENMYTKDDAAALFASLENGAVVRNLGIRNANVTTSFTPDKGQYSGGGAAIAVNNAGSILNCYVTSSTIAGDVTGIAVANNLEGGQVKNVYGGKITGDCKFFANNSGTSASNFVEYDPLESETGISKFDSKTGLTTSLNTFVDNENSQAITTSPVYYRWQNVDGNNNYYPVFTDYMQFYITYTNGENGKVEGVEYAKIDETVTVTVTPDAGYELDQLTRTFYFDGEENTEDIEGYSFVLEGGNTVVSATFKKVDLTVEFLSYLYEDGEEPDSITDEYGKITINGTLTESTAQVGNTVSIHVAPAEGCELQFLRTWYVDNEGDVLDTLYYKGKGGKIPSSFVMPAYATAVQGGFGYITYNVKIDEKIKNGAVESDPAFTTVGKPVTVTVTPDEGYEYVSNTLKYTYGQVVENITLGEDMKGTFNMPASDVTVTAQFEAIDYDIVSAVATHGSISFEKAGIATTTGNIGDEITVENAPDSYYELVSLNYEYTKGEKTTRDTIAEGKFTMPAANVTVTPGFDGRYFDIAIAETENGTVTTDAVPTENGYKQRYTHNVTMTFTPDNGYALDYVILRNANGTEFLRNVNTFEMPAHKVTIEAVFREAYWSDLGIRDTKWYTENPDVTNFTISTAAELGGLSYLVNGFDTDSLVSFKDKEITIENNISLAGYKWRPIGGMVLNANTFKGTFDGAEYTISDMNVSDSLGTYMAFFGINDGIIKNVEVAGTSIGEYWTAGIVGKNNQTGKIYNCCSNVSITTWFEAGGIAAYNYGTIENCYNRGNILNKQANHKSTMWVGGIAANNMSTGSITNCYNSGICTGSGNSPISYFGGIVGKNATQKNVANSYWVYEAKTNTTPKYGEVKGAGSGKIATTCASYTRAQAALQTGETGCLLDKLNTNVSASTSGLPLRSWANGPVDTYAYPVFATVSKGEEITDIDENVSSDINFNLYPNPAKDYVRIECEGITRITVVNMLGQVVINQNYDTDNVMLYVNDMTPGVYTVNVVTVNGNFTKNLVVTR